MPVPSHLCAIAYDDNGCKVWYEKTQIHKYTNTQTWNTKRQSHLYAVAYDDDGYEKTSTKKGNLKKCKK